MWKAIIGGIGAALLLLEVGVRVVTAWDRNHLDHVVNPPLVVEERDLTLGEIIRPVDNERIVYALRPGTRGYFLGRRIAINSHGFRDPERPLPKPADTVRIIGLGDSQMFGWGVEREETFLAVLEQRLARRFDERAFEAWNLAVPGYNAVQEAETFAETARRLDPDVVIINWVANDLELPSFVAERPNPWSLGRSFLSELVRRRLRLLHGRALPSLGLVEVSPDAATDGTAPAEEQVPEQYRPLVGAENMNAAYRRLARMARAEGARPVVLFDWNDPRTDGRGIEAFQKFCEAEGYLVVDTREDVVRFLENNRLEPSALWVSDEDPHPNPLRHRLIAEALAEALEPLLRVSVAGGPSLDPKRTGNRR